MLKLYKLRQLWERAGDSPLQRRNLPHPPRWSPAPPPHPHPRGYCRTPQSGKRASSPGWYEVRHWWSADLPHPHAQQQWFCLYSAPIVLRRNQSLKVLLVLPDVHVYWKWAVMDLYFCVLVSPGRWCVWCIVCMSGLQQWWTSLGTVCLQQTLCWSPWRCTGSSLYGF